MTSRISRDDLYLFNEGTHYRVHELLGAHLGRVQGVAGAHFAVWAPNASSVSVIGDWNGWDRSANRLEPREHSGIWEGFIPGVHEGSLYKLHVRARDSDFSADKTDPCGFMHETPPRSASIVRTAEQLRRCLPNASNVSTPPYAKSFKVFLCRKLK